MDLFEQKAPKIAETVQKHGLLVAIGDMQETRDLGLLEQALEQDHELQPRIPFNSPDQQIAELIASDRDDAATQAELIERVRQYCGGKGLIMAWSSGAVSLLFSVSGDLPTSQAMLEPDLRLQFVSPADSPHWGYAPGTVVNGHDLVSIVGGSLDPLPEEFGQRLRDQRSVLDQAAADTEAKASREMDACLPPKPAVYFEHLNDIQVDADQEPVIEGLLYRNSIAAVIGPTNIGKTFLVNHAGYCVGSDSEFLGCSVSPGLAAIVLAEAPASGRKRGVALRAYYGHKAQNASLIYIPSSVNLSGGGASVQPLLNVLQQAQDETKRRLQLVVIDTAAAAMVGGDENSAKDMAEFLDNLDRLRAATGACVLVVHHLGKDASKGARGHSSFKARLDTELSVAPGVLTVTKQRDAEYHRPIGFELIQVEIGRTKRGKSITSCVVGSSNVAAQEAFTPIHLPANAQNALRVLQDLSMNGRKVPVSEWKSEFIRLRYPGKKSTGGREFKRALAKLMPSGRVTIDGGQNASAC